MELQLFISVLKFYAMSELKITNYMWDVFLLVDGSFDCVNKVLQWLCARVYIFLLILVEIVLSVSAKQFCLYFLKGLKLFFFGEGLTAVCHSVCVKIQSDSNNVDGFWFIHAVDSSRSWISIHGDGLVSVQDDWKLFCCNCHKDFNVCYSILCFSPHTL